jgi:hypothetical protein
MVKEKEFVFWLVVWPLKLQRSYVKIKNGILTDVSFPLIYITQSQPPWYSYIWEWKYNFFQVNLTSIYTYIHLQLKVFIIHNRSRDGYWPSPQMGSVIYAPDSTPSGRSIREVKDTDAPCIKMKWSHPIFSQI